MRAYDLLSDFLAGDQALLAQCRDFGLKLGYDENSPEWATFVMPFFIQRLVHQEVTTIVAPIVREAIAELFASNALSQQVLEGTRAAVKAAHAEEVEGTRTLLAQAVSSSVERTMPNDLARVLKATLELLASVKLALDTSNARQAELLTLPEQLGAIVVQLKGLLAQRQGPFTKLFSARR